MKRFFVPKACINYFQKQTGFTLIEAVIVLAMIGILAGIATPAIIHWLPDYRLRQAAMDIRSNMQKARIEAIKRNTYISIVFTPATYTPSGNVGSYKIFVDDGNGVQDGGEQLLTQVTMPKSVSLYFDNFAGHTTGFNNRGLPWKNNRWGSVYLRNSNSRYYKLSLSKAGNISIQKSNDGATWN